jgi:hypothetical protein
MKRVFLVILLTLSGFIHLANGWAYEVTTHEDMSQKALEASILVSPSSVLDDLLLKGVAEDTQKFPGADGKERTILDLIKYGANQEDNLYIPAVAGSRFMQHFYDPRSGGPLTDFTPAELQGLSLLYGDPYQPIQASPRWALEDEQDFLDNKIAGQIFSYKDGRKYFYKALTEFTKSDREKSFGLMFQTLGHVIHHIQDMAQPQHVKNEKHPPISPGGLYEHYTNEEPIRTRLPFGGYAAVDSLDSDRPTFDSPQKFWATSNGMGKGLAEFTNFNFITYAHNFTGTLEHFAPDPIYPNPSGTPATLTAIDFSLVPTDGLAPSPLDGKMYFIGTPVTDFYRPDRSGDNNLTSTYSIYDDDMHRWNLRVKCLPVLDSPSPDCTQQAIFSVNRFTMNAAHQFLIPRAVGYSAGLINYFFRGKIDMVPDPTNPGRFVIKNEGKETLSGSFTLYYDDAEGNRVAVVPDPIRDPEPTPWSTPFPEGLKPGATMPVPTFAPPPTGLRPPPKTPGEYTLVFQGTMGQEAISAIAGRVVTIHPPSFLIPTGRFRYINNIWQFDPDPMVQYGNVDWQGPDNLTVSWHAGTTRALNDLGPWALDNKIYQAGALLAEAPGKVSGAAIQKGSDGTTYLIAVVTTLTAPTFEEEPYPTWTGTDTIYRKMLPDGSWVKIGEWSYPKELTIGFTQHVGLWHFNPDGTEAISVKLAFDFSLNSPITRTFKMSVPRGGEVSVTSASSSDTVQAADYTSDGVLKAAIYNIDNLTLELPSFSIDLLGTVLLFLDMRYEVAIYMTLESTGTAVVYLHTPQGRVAMNAFVVSNQLQRVPGGEFSPSRFLPGTPTFWFVGSGHPIYGIRPQFLWGWWQGEADFGPVQLGEELHGIVLGGVMPNLVWAAVNRDGAVAVGLRQLEGTQWEPGLGPLLVWGQNVNRIYNADLSFQEIPVSDPTGVVHPIGQE